MMLNGRCPGHGTGLSRQTSAQRNHVQGLRHGYQTSGLERGRVLRVATRETQAAVPDLADTSSSSHTEPAGAASACPFLAALPAPPSAQHKWWTRLLQLKDPPVFQAAALGPHKVVQAGSELGLPAQIVIGDADLARMVLAGEGDITQQGNFLKGFSNLIGPESLLTVQDPRHKYLRALIMPAFEKPAIERLVPRMETVLSKHLNSWCERTDAEGATVKAADECKTMTFDFIINVIIGRDLSESELASLIDTYKVWANGIILGFPYINLPFTRFGRALRARTELLKWLQVEVDRARAEHAAGQQVPSILTSLISAVDENGDRLTDSEVLDNLLLLLLAGHDTSAITLTNVLAQLHKSPAAMQQLRQEQQGVVAKHGLALSGAVLKEMDYADAVIRETLRLLPVVPSLSRQATKDFDLGGYSVKEGQYLVSGFAHMASKDPRWRNDDPQQFRPERMMTPEGQKPGWQMPFGYGPRFCAGYAVAMAEMKTFLALLARDYEFTADTNTEWKQMIGRVPVNGLPMRVSRRKA